MINVTKLVKEAAEITAQDHPDSNRGALREDDIVLTQVKLEVTHINWTNTSPTDNPSHPRTVNITKSNTASAEAFGQVQATQEDQNFIRVRLDKGIVRGINRSLKLPLNANKEELINAFGNYVEIDISKPMSEPPQDKIKIRVAVEGALGPRGATATLTNKEKEYKGHFVGTVIMYGKALAGRLESEVGEFILDLKNASADNEDLKALTMTTRKKKKAVTFTIEGDLECKWDFEQTVEWK